MTESTATPATPSFEEFARWLARGQVPQSSAVSPLRYGALMSAAQRAREETLKAQAEARTVIAARPAKPRHFEVLQLIAAASDESARPPELTTARGFRVTLSYDDGTDATTSSICVLVRCPPDLADRLQGESAYLWNGSERFELGQFDAEGKAIGTLPAGIEISLSDFTQGRVKLEEPPPGED